MTASPSTPSGPNPPQGGGGDPSMEDILASIRRILNEDENEPAEAAPEAHDVVPLDASMLVEEPDTHIARAPATQAPVAQAPAPSPPVPPAPAPAPAASVSPPSPAAHAPPAAAPQPPAAPPPSPPSSSAPMPAEAEARAEVQSQAGLLAPEAAAKASSSVGSLLRTLANERQQVAVRAGGPTIEDLVREEIRPLLKAWLDANLPPLVERLVRAEIERVVGRALS